MILRNFEKKKKKKIYRDFPIHLRKFRGKSCRNFGTFKEIS